MDAGEIRLVDELISNAETRIRASLQAEIAALAAGLEALALQHVPAAVIDDEPDELPAVAVADAELDSDEEPGDGDEGEAEEVAEEVAEVAELVAQEASYDAAPSREHFLTRPLFGRRD